MTRSAIAGRAQTVLGPIDTDEMGVTLPHEHILIDFTLMFTEPEGERERELARQPVRLDNLGWVRRNFSSNLDNLRLADESVARDELGLYRLAGGRTLVDPTNRGLARDPLALARLACATGLNIIMGSGYYVAASHPRDMDAKTVDGIAREIVADLIVGVEDTGVRAGFIGEIGTTWPWTANERKVVQAAVLAQRETGAPLMIHPGRHERLPLEIVDVVRREGGDLRRTIMCHIERTIVDRAVLLELAATGVYLEYDLFGVESSYYPYNPAFDMPNDAGRIRQIQLLIERGHLDQVLMSHDIAYKHCLTRWGGHGYSHLLVSVVPQLRLRGIDDKTIEILLVDNPRRAFVFAEGA
jgi:phosphotriesterase-related protein